MIRCQDRIKVSPLKLRNNCRILPALQPVAQSGDVKGVTFQILDNCCRRGAGGQIELLDRSCSGTLKVIVTCSRVIQPLIVFTSAVEGWSASPLVETLPENDQIPAD